MKEEELLLFFYLFRIRRKKLSNLKVLKLHKVPLQTQEAYALIAREALNLPDNCPSKSANINGTTINGYPILSYQLAPDEELEAILKAEKSGNSSSEADPSPNLTIAQEALNLSKESPKPLANLDAPLLRPQEETLRPLFLLSWQRFGT